MKDSPFKNIIELLESNQVNYRLLDHEPVFTSEEAARVRGLDGGTGAKALLLKCGQEYCLLVIPGDKKLDNKKVRNQLEVKEIRFATPEEVVEISGARIGAVYPFGQLMGVRMLVDQSLQTNRVIAFNPGVHEKSVVLEYRDYQKLVNPVLADLVREAD